MSKGLNADLKVEIFFPLYVGDYDRDTADLSFEEHGFYMAILRALWVRGGVLQAADKQRLARVLRTDVETLDRLWPAVVRFFTIKSDGSFSQKRLSTELQKAKNNKALAVERASKGGKARAASAASSSAPSSTPSTQQAVLQEVLQVSTSPSPSPSPSEIPDPPTPLAADGADPDAVDPLRPDADPNVPLTGTELQRLFTRLWVEHKKDPPRPEQWDAKDANALIASLPPGAARAKAAAQIKPAILRYLADTDQRYVRLNHPLRLLCKDFEAFRPRSSDQQTSRPLSKIPMPQPNARQLAREMDATEKRE